MKIFVKVKPNSKETKVEKIDKSHFEVWVNELPVKGKVNDALVKILAGFFSVPQANIRITHGRTSKQKMVEIIEQS